MRPVATRIDVGAAVLGGHLCEPASIVIDPSGSILAVGTPSAVGEVAEASGMERRTFPDLVAVPGFIDLQVNGSVGHSFGAGEVEGNRAVLAHLLESGTTSCCPTVTTSASETYGPALRALAEAAAAGGAWRQSRVLGAHLEGPFLAAARRGAHPERLLQVPDLAWLLDTVASSPTPVAIVTLAPELPGALEVVTALVEAGVVASAGHTDASYEDMVEAVGSGLSMVTHLFNAQRPLGHRDPGVIGAAFDLPGLHVGLVVDGVHVHPAVRRLAVAALGERLFAVTDAVAPAGLPQGSHQLGRGEIATTSGAARLADGTLAGSIISMAEAFRSLLHDHGWMVATHACSTAPAAALGRRDVGVLEAGRRADIVLVDRSGAVQGVIAGCHLPELRYLERFPDS